MLLFTLLSLITLDYKKVIFCSIRGGINGNINTTFRELGFFHIFHILEIQTTARVWLWIIVDLNISKREFSLSREFYFVHLSNSNVSFIFHVVVYFHEVWVVELWLLAKDDLIYASLMMSWVDWHMGCYYYALPCWFFIKLFIV